MSAVRLTRRASLLLPFLLPFLLAACGGEPKVYRQLRYDYLRPINLAVKTVEVEQRFVPSGVAPDIGKQSPVDPVATLRQMGEDRIKPFGNTNRAVFSITDASLIRHDDVIRGSLEATLEIMTDDGQPAGYAQARVTRRHTGRTDDPQQILYDMVSGMMDDMNIELEFQIRNSLKQWLASEAPAIPDAVEATPLPTPARR